MPPVRAAENARRISSLLDYAPVKTFILRTLCLVIFLAPLAAATDDNLGLTPDSVALYEK